MAAHALTQNARPLSLSASTGIWLAFITVQALDGVFTYVGIRSLGLSVEANPLIAWYVEAFGPGVALTGAKLVAASCATVLCLTARHRTVAVLTLIYLVGAIAPWVHLLLEHEVL